MSRPSLDESAAALTTTARELLGRARAALESRYRAGVHEVAAAIRTADGATHVGLHVESSQGRAAVCAEGAALSATILGGGAAVEVVGVLRRPGGTWHLIEPCGVCAELLVDHCPDATVWATPGGVTTSMRAADLLPARVARAGREMTETKEEK